MNKIEKKEFLDTIYLFKSETTSELSVPEITWAVKQLHRLEVTLTRLSIMACNGDIDDDTYQKKTEPIENKVKGIADTLGFDVRFNGDPRGAAICFLIPSGHHNSWDGETWRLHW